MTLGPTGRIVRDKLTAAFRPAVLDLFDESHLHAGHAGARPQGETHFRLKIIAEAFRDKSRIERHRMVNAILAEELRDRIHALTITADAI